MERMKIQELFDQFLRYGQVIRNYKPLTISHYQTTFKLFLKDAGIVYLDELNSRVLEEWFFNGRMKRRWSPVTFRHYLKHMNVLMKWLIRKEYVCENYIKDLEKPKLEFRLPRSLPSDKASLILDAAFHMKYRYHFEKYRNRAVIAVMLLAGLRRCEVVSLKLNDVSLENKAIFIDQGKGSKDRVIPINARLHSTLFVYLKDRARLNVDSVHFFVSLSKGKSFGIKGITNLVARLRNFTGIKFSAHMLRHSFATLMLEGGCDIYTLSQIMGHSKITTTTIYLSCSNAQMGKSIEMHVLN
jgi:site-specific recombinase XerD